MAEEFDPNAGAEDDPNGFSTFYVGLVGMWIVVAAVALVSGVYYWMEATAVEDVNSQPYQIMIDMDNEQYGNLNKSGTITGPDGERRTVMNIETAMEQVVKEATQ